MGKHEPKKSREFMRGQHQRHLRRIANATIGYKGVKSNARMFERQTEAYIRLLRQQDALWGDTYNIDRLPERVKQFKEDLAFAEARKHNNRLIRGNW